MPARPGRRFRPLFFGAGGTWMGSNHSGIENQPFEVRVLQRLEDNFPCALARPAVESLPNRVPFAESLRQIAPRHARFRNPKDCIDESTIVFTEPSSLPFPTWKQVLYPIPIGIRYRMAS